MRKVFSNSAECAHIFAQRTQNEGEAEHVFFRGNTIYSYGEHFPVATFHTNKKQETIVLFTTADYSVTTSQHKNIIRGALSQYNIIYVPYPNEIRHADTLISFKARLEEMSKKIVTAKKNSEYYLNQYNDIVNGANNYCKFFGLKNKFSNKLDLVKIKKLVESQKQLAREATNKKKQLEKEDLDLWKEGKFNGYFHHLNTQYLRLKNAETVETTKGSTFPLSHAKLAYKKVINCIDKNESWHRNGEEIRVGNFMIDSIDERGNVKAGCHFIKFDEIDRFATVAGIK